MIKSGIEVLFEGLIDGGVKFHAGYPITPASELISLSKKLQEREVDYNYIDTEDEVIAIHMAIGASLGGKLSLVSTSGPGFSLMQEGISLAYLYGIPLIIVDIMRQGPSTGMPTVSSQSDMLSAIYGGHGDSYRVVFTADSLDSVYNLAFWGSLISVIYMTPIIILLDASTARLVDSIDSGYKSKVDIGLSFDNILQSEKKLYTGLYSIDGSVATYGSYSYEINNSTFHKKLDSIRNIVNKPERRLSSLLQLTSGFKIKSLFYKYIERVNGSSSLIVCMGFLAREIEYNSVYDDFDILIIRSLHPISDDLAEIVAKYKKVFVVEQNESNQLLGLIPHKCSVHYISIKVAGGLDDLSIMQDKILAGGKDV